MSQHRSKPAIALLFTILVSACSPSYDQGKVLYQFHCENCHMPDGSGLARLIPDLKGSVMIRDNRTEDLVCLIQMGTYSPLTGQEMPANNSLNDVEMTNLVNYVSSAFGSRRNMILPDSVRHWMSACDAVEN